MRRYRSRVHLHSPEEGEASLSQEESHYLTHVLRVQTGDILELFDGRGNLYEGRVRSLDPLVRVEILSVKQSLSESPLRSILALALIKGERFEWALQKATELGITEIIPLSCRHCEVKVYREEAMANRQGRWEKILESAARQSGRSLVPVLYPVCRFRAMIEWIQGVSGVDGNHRSGKTLPDVVPEFRLALIEQGGRPLGQVSLSGHPANILTVVGPEGGWDREEQARLEKTCCPVTLGPRVLRSETAAAAVTALVQSLWGDMGSSEFLPLFLGKKEREDRRQSDCSQDDAKGDADGKMSSEPAIQDDHLGADEGQNHC